MAIRNFFGFDDVPVPAGEQIAITVLLPPLPFAFKPGTTAGVGGVTYLKEGGWLKCKNTAPDSSTQGVKNNYTTNTLQEVGLNPTASSVVTVGLRWVCPAVVTLVTHWPHPIAITVAGLSQANIILGSAFSFGDIPGWTAGKEYYLEAQYDVPAAVIRRRVDGVAIADKVMDSNIVTAFGAGTARLIMGCYNPGSTTLARLDYSWWIKDMYLIEKTGDGTADNFLGPQQVVPITVANLDQPTWVATGAADVTSALNTDITDTASLATPIVTTDIANPIANIGLSVPNFQGQINGVILTMAGRKKDGASGIVGSQVVSGANSSANVNANLTNTPTSGYRLYLAEKSPAGIRWTRSALQAAKLKLTTG